MDSQTRAGELHDSFNAQKRHGRLAKLLIMAHAPAVIWQQVITIALGVLEFMPQVSLYKLLTALEAQSPSSSIDPTAIAWAVGLGMSMLFETLADTYMWHSSRAFVHIPVRVQLSALLFGKSMRRKDVKGVQKDDGSNQESAENPGLEYNLQNTRQGTINLIGFDTARISEFCIYQNIFMLVLCKMVLSFIFLYLLIGWQALLAGVAGQMLIFPLTSYYARKYTRAQNDLMSARDRKLAILNEALTGIRQIKFSALEIQWQKWILEAREQELSALWTSFRADTFISFSWLCGPVLLSAMSISVYAMIYGSISASIAFTTISVLETLQATMTWIPELITNLVDAWISLERIETYLNSPERVEYLMPGESISFQNACIAWPSDSDTIEDFLEFSLRDLNFSFPNNELSIISGKTGSGKSLLLAAILGEADLLSGSIVVPRAPALQDRFDGKAHQSNWIIPSSLAFVSQQPWIENETFRNNILFGLPLDEVRYKKVLSACALDQDLSLLPDGDMTEIGANGINLSGGQRWRITLARALYSRAGILVMDDIFSAVDAHVGLHLLENAIAGELGRSRTRIIVTHHVSLCLSQANYAIHLGNGTIDHAGSVEELRKTGELDQVLKEEEEAMSEEEDSFPPSLEPFDQNTKSPVSDDHKHQQNSGCIKKRARRTSKLSERRMSAISSRSSKIDDGGLSITPKPPAKKFVEEETRQAGRVAWSVYQRHMSAGGGFWQWGLVLLVFGLYEAGLLGQYYWLVIWTQSYQTKAQLLQLASKISNYQMITFPSSIVAVSMDSDLIFYLSVYFGIAMLLCIGGALRYFLVFRVSINASRKLFRDFTYAVLRAPMRWLDTVPLGRILNRFTSDFNVVDSEMGLAVAMVFNFSLRVLGITIAGLIVSPYTIAFAVILIGINSRYAIYFLKGARETKRLESVTKSPVFDLFGTALAGVSTIRAFGKTEVYINRMFEKIDDYGRSLWYMWLFNQWLVFRLGILGATFTMAIALLVVSMKDIGAPLAGFALTFTLQYSVSVMWVLRQYATVELGMNATERIIEYSELTIEEQGGADAPAAWPTEGVLEVTNLVISYAPDLPPVLKGLTFRVNGNERIGVVGRTGAGKSSLTLALFRFLEAREGSILIDGIDISKIKLKDLRSRLAIIPQDPVLFSGTVRSNLDPFDEHTDGELREALQRVHLIPPSASPSTSASSPTSVRSAIAQTTVPQQHNINPFASLQAPISEGGQNLSQGQRQLLCLARAILSRPKLLVLDEATSAVDKATDELIQHSIREEFQNSTMIVIAHRLSTVADFDRILVLAEGKVVEFGKPIELMLKGGGEQKGAFAELVEKSGEESLLKRVIFGERERG